jgi:hypothetical protein
MDENKYYAVRRYFPRKIRPEELWKMNHRIHLATSSDSKLTPGLCAYIAIGEDFEDRPLDISGNDECRRITKQTFQKYWNESFDSFQKARLRGGEYYIDRSESGDCITFHAFLREPSRHYEVICRQEVDLAQFQIEVENCITYRRGIANHNPAIPESVFCQAFKLALEFFYDGSAMPVNQGKLWEVLDALGGSAVPDEPVIINEDYYYQRARELMLKRKEEIKFRLLELDDAPSRRKELRAEMRGIDYCVSILDENH